MASTVYERETCFAERRLSSPTETDGISESAADYLEETFDVNSFRIQILQFICESFCFELHLFLWACRPCSRSKCSFQVQLKFRFCRVRMFTSRLLPSPGTFDHFVVVKKKTKKKNIGVSVLCV